MVLLHPVFICSFFCLLIISHPISSQFLFGANNGQGFGFSSRRAGVGGNQRPSINQPININVGTLINSIFPGVLPKAVTQIFNLPVFRVDSIIKMLPCFTGGRDFGAFVNCFFRSLPNVPRDFVITPDNVPSSLVEISMILLEESHLPDVGKLDLVKQIRECGGKDRSDAAVPSFITCIIEKILPVDKLLAGVVGSGAERDEESGTTRSRTRRRRSTSTHLLFSTTDKIAIQPLYRQICKKFTGKSDCTKNISISRKDDGGMLLTIEKE